MIIEEATREQAIREMLQFAKEKQSANEDQLMVLTCPWAVVQSVVIAANGMM